MLEEGVKQRLYLDTKGIPTAGVGRNMRDVGLRNDEIELMLQNDIIDNNNQLAAHFPWYGTLDPVRKCALLDLSFAGVTTLLGFVHMLYALSTGDYVNASKECVNSKWFTDVGPARGNRVAGMIETGMWPKDINYGDAHG